VAPLVVSSSRLPFDVAGALAGAAEYRAPAAGHMPRAELVAAVRDADALIALLTDRVDDELLAAAPRLRVVANCAVGYDNVDVAAATRRRVAVTNTPDVLTETTADFTFALLLGAARRLVEGDALVRSGTWTGWEPDQLLGAEVGGAALGIVGLGRIGRAVARRAVGFGMTIRYAGPRDVPGADALGAARVSLDELLARSDFVSLHCPLTEATRHLIDAAALARMRPGAILINTARGGCVDEAALAAALAAATPATPATIAGAALDVFEREPHVHAALVASEKVLLAPHAGSATTTTRGRMAGICAQAVRDALAGRRPATVVNPEVYG
jgi:glyoxylate reductase